MRRRARVSEVFGPKLRAAESRLRLFIQREERPADLRDQRITMRLGGARTGKRALVIEQLELDGLTDPFDLEVDFGERVAVLGGNGAGKSHFLRLLNADETVAHHGRWRLGAGVVPGLFHQTHEHPEWIGRTLLEILHDHDVVRGPAMSMLRRYEIHGCAEQPFETLSGGQQARFQILLLERSGATMLLLDEPTDNLDLVSAEALEAGPRRVHRHRDRGHPRPLVPAPIRPLRRVRFRLLGDRPPLGPPALGDRVGQPATCPDPRTGRPAPHFLNWAADSPETVPVAAQNAACRRCPRRGRGRRRRRDPRRRARP